MILKPQKIEKIWGYELWIHNDSQYCGKLLVFTKADNEFSMHYHILKNETWYVQSGQFQFDWIDTENGKRNYTTLKEGDVVYIQKGMPHKLIALNDNATIFEVSTEHFDSDSYRIYKNTPNDLI
jgi:mannose-6-phosphate isomerase-like protein (cupin superfamily)